jgi:hypothetical protein
MRAMKARMMKWEEQVTKGEERKHAGFWRGRLKITDHYKDTGLKGMIMLKQVLTK